MEESASESWRRRAKGYGCLLLVFILLPLAALKACQWNDRHPSDRQMLQEFAERQNDFEALRQMMLSESRVTRIADDFIWVDGMSNVSGTDRGEYLFDQRYNDYRALFDRLNLESGVIRYDDGSIGLLRSSSGLVTSGSSKGFIWSQSVQTAALTKSDTRTLEEACQPKTRCSAIRKMAGDWYMIYEIH